MQRIIILILLVSFSNELLAQRFISQREDALADATGFQRLEILHELTSYYDGYDEKKARKYGRQANTMSDNFLSSNTLYTSEEQSLIINSKLAYADVLYKRESYLDAQSVYNEAKAGASKFEFLKGISRADDQLAAIDSLTAAGVVKENFFSKTFGDLNVGEAISKSTSSMATSSELKLGQLYEKRGDTAVAIQHYSKAAELLRKRGDIEEAEVIESKIETFQEMHILDSLQKEIMEHPDSISAVYADRVAEDSSRVLTLPKMNAEIDIDSKNKLDELRIRAEASERGGDLESSLNYYKQYLELQQKYHDDSITRVLAYNLSESRREQLRQQNENADLSIKSIRQEKEAEAKLNSILIVVASIIAVATLGLLFMYFSKRKKHSQLTAAYSDLDEAKVQLEDAEKHISNLLSQQVSPEIASALINEKPQREKQFVAVMFLDIRDFTAKAEKMDPVGLIEYQNNVFGFMIEIIREMHGNINQFMGDGFMATFGAPVSHGNDAANAFQAGVRILEQIKLKNESKVIPETRLGIGIHAGYVVTGNVGTELRKQFSVTGNTVIIAARVEQLNKKYGSQMIITEEVYNAVDKADFQKEPEMMAVQVKGRTEPVNILVVDETELKRSFVDATS